MRPEPTASPLFLEIPSPLGRLALEAKAGRLTALRFDARGGAVRPSGPELAAAAEQLEQYFAGRRRGFELPLSHRRGRSTVGFSTPSARSVTASGPPTGT
jgi:6-O-methylguanine DNA methyltransferase-like protein